MSTGNRDNSQKLEKKSVETFTHGESSGLLSNKKYEYVGLFTRLGARFVDLIIYLAVSTLLLNFVVAPIAQNQLSISNSDISKFNNLLENRITELVENDTSFQGLTESFQQTVNPDCELLFGGNDEDLQLCNSTTNYDRIDVISTSVIGLLFSIVYFVLLSISMWQATLGKKLFKIKIVDQNYNKISVLQAFARESFYIAQGVIAVLASFYTPVTAAYTIITLFIVVDGIQIFFSTKRQAIHDKLADTYVVKLNEEL
ncbi:MAG: RDD family protein [Patescibacteria group bacterium]